MAELADALDSGSSGSNTVQVQVLLSAPEKMRPVERLVFFSGTVTCGASRRLRAGIPVRFAHSNVVGNLTVPPDPLRKCEPFLGADT